MLQLRIVQLMLIMSLGTVSLLFSGRLSAQTQRDSPTTIPSLSGYDGETRQSIELACIVKKSDGPVAYGTCLNQQIASLKGSPSIPNLSSYDSETRQSIDLACIVKKPEGPVAYGICLHRQIASLQGSSGIPSLSGYDSETRQSIELACITEKSNGPVAYGDCLRAQLQSMGVHPGDITRVLSARSKRVDVKARSISSGFSTSPSQATLRDQMGSLRYWQDPTFWAPLIVIFVLLTPILWVLFSNRSRGGAKLGWFLVVMFFSWLGLAKFLIATQTPRNREDT
jgi:hypothetical protein